MQTVFAGKGDSNDPVPLSGSAGQDRRVDGKDGPHLDLSACTFIAPSS